MNKNKMSTKGGKNKKVCLSTRQGSILAYSLIILAMMLAIATSLSVSTIIEKKSASSTEFSVQSLQTADSGVQLALKKINGNLVKPVNDPVNFSSCTVVGGTATVADQNDAGVVGVYTLSFYQADGAKVNCTDLANSIGLIRSVGVYKNTVRAVNVSVAPACGSTVKDRNFASNNLEYGTVLVGSYCMLDRNLGANHTASSNSDVGSYGWYFQWGRLADGHQIPASGTTTTKSISDTPGHGNFILSQDSDLLPNDWRTTPNDNLWKSTNTDGGTNNPCPSGFYVPTTAQWNAIIIAAGINTSSVDSAVNSPLKLSAAGFRAYNLNLMSNQGSVAMYWSSTPSAGGAERVYIAGVSTFSSDSHRAYGIPVRCLRN